MLLDIRDRIVIGDTDLAGRIMTPHGHSIVCR